MTTIHEIRLEIVRPGPSHNQLLSPLTRYTALCGDSAPITFSINMEQHKLSDILTRLRYYRRENNDALAIPESVREAAVKEAGQESGYVFAKLTNLLFEEGRTLGETEVGRTSDKEHIIHLRLISSASELSHVPFEMAISPPASPSEGSRMLLGKNLPIVMTREIRRSRPAPVTWNLKDGPKILLIAAQPGLLRVPQAAHVKALHSSLKPWIGRAQGKSKKLDAAKERLRVLTDASLPEIYDLCSKERFSHIHVLAHGGEYTEAGEQRYGLILCDAKDKSKKHCVSGTNIAKAIQAESAGADWRSEPKVVTLATCDSGAQGSILIPGGSIAHDLHLAGLPVVIASQFPLTKTGSVLLTKTLYPRLLRGDDPRRALFEVRRVLCSLHDRAHDWASLIVYASLSDDFDAQVMSFFEAQCKRAIEVSLAHGDSTTESKIEDGKISEELLNEGVDALREAEETLNFWATRLPDGKKMQDRVRRAEHFGMCGSTFKRIALIYKRKKNEEQYRENLQRALANYERAVNEWAMDESKFHWAATQALSIKTVLTDAADTMSIFQPVEEDVAMYFMARELASRDAQAGETKEARAWGFATLAELDLLATPFDEWRTDRDQEPDTKAKRVRNNCSQVVNCVGPDHFAVESTRRQFQRYVDFWLGSKEYPLKDIAEEAVKILRGK